MTSYRFVECSSCSLRFPGEAFVPCPVCKTPTDAGIPPLPARPTPRSASRPLEFFVDNVRSVFNVGSLFRSADGAGVSHIYLGGISPGPSHKQMAKTALGAEHTVPSSSHPNGARLASHLRSLGKTLWALEACEGAVSIFDTGPRPNDLVVVLGNEVCGVDPQVLEHCQAQISLPMQGRKHSLNVATAAGVAAYYLAFLAP